MKEHHHLIAEDNEKVTVKLGPNAVLREVRYGVQCFYKFDGKELLVAAYSCPGWQGRPLILTPHFRLVEGELSFYCGEKNTLILVCWDEA